MQVAKWGNSLAIRIPAAVTKALKNNRVLHRYKDLLGVEARVVSGSAGGLELLVLDAPALFARDDGPYCDPTGEDWPDNWLRFAALSRAAADVAQGVATDLHPQLLHAHDWQAAMGPAYLRFGKGDPVPSVVTIHNMFFQGWFPADIFSSLNLPAEAFTIEGVEYFGGVGFLKAGLQAADAITTVSPTYAREITTGYEFGRGLEGVLLKRKGDLVGILNGLDSSAWD